MPRMTVAGLPLHPIINDYPAVLFPTSLVFDLMYRSTRRRAYAQTAYFTLVGGYFSAMAAGMAGLADYTAIPRNTEVKRMANIHMLLNVGLLGVSTANIMLRRGHRTPTGTLPLVLSALGSTGLLISGLIGQRMVYEHGMRVKGAGSMEGTREIKVPGDEAIANALRGLVRRMSPKRVVARRE